MKDIIVNEDLRKQIISIEKENFLGVRPFFILLKNQIDTLPDNTYQEKYRLHHVSQSEMRCFRTIQQFFRDKIANDRILQEDERETPIVKTRIQ